MKERIYIQQNNIDLVKELEKMGFTSNDPEIDFKLPFLYIEDNTSFNLGIQYGQANYGAPLLFNTNSSVIKCKNRNQFLAIAALMNSENDINKWFIITSSFLDYKNNEVKKGTWWKNMIYKNINNSFLKDHCRKATVDEILNHF